MRDNVRKVVKIIDQAKRKIQSRVLFFANAEKAFNRIEWFFFFLKVAIERTGLGQKIRTLIEAVYKDPTARLIINSQLSEDLKFSRGIWQGCPLSSLLFNIGLEMLAIAERKAEEIRGVKIQKEKFKLAQ